ncbi:12944_t:CDS:2 [Ambispora leptoticha]|uniref:12944_t:CDS:1 n=1 Tax=Ambispora leptoticha TaxID=144679 RepID=A0A9N8ZJI0_9GLOM|nr:12944_t:CDS:2 [Ambispora leptoticha]
MTTLNNESNQSFVTHTGSCHCKKVIFQVDAPKILEVQDCNCSICTKKGFLHLIVPNSRFRILQGKDDLSVYTFNTHVAKHYFCNTCGVSPFYIPRSNPDGWDINFRCIDPDTVESFTVVKFDGQNWESNAENLAHLSKS